MRIAFVCGSFPPMKCGVGDYTAHLAGSIAASVDQVDVITSTTVETISPDNVRVHPLVERWDMRAAPRILRKLRETGADIVNIQYPTQEYGRHPVVNILPWLIRFRLGLAAVATIHEYSSYTWLGRARLALAAKLSHRVITTDALNRRLLHHWAGGPRERYALIPIGPNLECSPPPGYDRAMQRAKLGAGPDSVVFAYFGFISPSKGLDTLLPAFAAALQGAREKDIHLWLLADREPSAERYRSYHAALEEGFAAFPHRDRVAWTGYLSPADLSAHLLAADAAILPFGDGASLRRGSLLAVLTHGLPVISTIGPGTASDGLNEDRGLLLVPVGDAGALAEAALTLAGDASLRDTLARRARQYSSTFSWPSIAAQTLAVYAGALMG